MTDEQWIPGNKKELMAAIEHEWTLLINLADSLTDEQMSTPDAGGWSPRDNLAHLAEWMHILMGYHMDRRPAHEVMGVSEDVTKGWDMEVINPVLFERNKNRSRSDVMDGLKTVYNQLIAKLEATPFEDLLKPR
ncbi:MAG: ClbS/DfsB family four-helix bundle protein, partial [Chloroflexi bacterium]